MDTRNGGGLQPQTQQLQPNDENKSQASRKSFARNNGYQRQATSHSFKPDGASDAGEMKIENDRLQTQMMILQ